MYALMRRLLAHMTVLRGGEQGTDWAAVAQAYGYSDPAQAAEIYQLLALAGAYLQAEMLPDGKTPNPVRLLMHKLG